ncbi:MAG: serine/threonine-protein kinase PknK, partial [Pirellulales bacterium]|nr:serine/threonine-protein kinase PknK [Pirellulales bacterium]
MPHDEPLEPDRFDEALFAYDEYLRQGQLPRPAALDPRVPPTIATEDLEACRRCLLWLEAVWPRQQDSSPPRGQDHSAPTEALTGRGQATHDRAGPAELGPGTELGPLVIREELGRGGMGIVYKALDRRQNVHVALKMLREEGHAAVRRLKHEFRMLAEIVHPNLVVLEELYLVDQQWFFTMELVEGQPFADYVRGRSRWPTSSLSLATSGDPHGLVPRVNEVQQLEDVTQRSSSPLPPRAAGAEGSSASCDVSVTTNSASGTSQRFPALQNPAQFARLRSTLAQMADGLAALHRAGILHRDIKPSNVLVTPEGRVVLVDFGLAADVLNHAAAGGRGVELAGTWDYMAPEQSAGEPLSAASDWYSVGVMLWEILFGQRPFEGHPEEVLRQKRAGPPPLEAGVLPAEHADLAALCRQMLQPDVAARPSEEEILGQLQRGTAGDALPPRGASAESIFVGRTESSQRLMEAYVQSRQGQTTSALVHGPPGIGKTALVEHFLARIEQEGDVLVLRGRCYERESVPYQALDSIVDDLAELLAAWPQADVLSLLFEVVPKRGQVPRDAAFSEKAAASGSEPVPVLEPAAANLEPLLQVFPGLGRIVRTARREAQTGPLPEARETRRLAIEALRGLLARLAARRPV